MNARRHEHRPALSEPPRLGVGHLLLWVTGCAVYIASVRAAASETPDLLGLAIVAVQAVGYGAALAGLAIFLTRRLRGRPWPIEPGEWLLFVLGARLAAELVIYGWLDRYVSFPRQLSDALTCCLLVLPLLSRRLDVAWKLFFLVMLLLFARTAVELCLAALGPRTILPRAINSSWGWLEVHRVWLLPTLAALLIVYDLIGRRHRTWLHWMGLATLVWYLAMLTLLATQA